MGGTQGGWARPHGGPITPPPDPNRRKPTREQHKAKLQELFKKHGHNRKAYYKELRKWQDSFNEPEQRMYPTGGWDDGIYPGHPDWPKDMPGQDEWTKAGKHKPRRPEGMTDRDWLRYRYGSGGWNVPNQRGPYDRFPEGKGRQRTRQEGPGRRRRRSGQGIPNFQQRLSSSRR